MKSPAGIDSYEWFGVEGTVVGWLVTDSEDNVYEDDVAVVQQDDGRCFIRWLGNDWTVVDPPDAEEAVVGTRIKFTTNWHEQIDYAKIALGKE